MATSGLGTDRSMVAGGTLTASQYCAVTLETDGTVILANNQGERTFGILQDDASVTINSTAGTNGCTIRIAGITKAKAGGIIACGARCTNSATTGALETAASGDFVIGIALEYAASGDVFSMLIVQPETPFVT